MNTYRVMVHPEKAVPVVVKIGYCWPAFLIGPLWFVVNGMWLNFLLVTAFVVSSNFFFAGRFGGGTLYGFLGALNAIVWILIGAFANWLLTAELREQGYVQRGTVQASGMMKAGKLAQRDGEAPEDPGTRT